MNKKTILILLVVAIIGIIIYLKKGSGDGTGQIWTGNVVSASYGPNAIDEPVGEMPPHAEIFIDASGSMKPYFTADGANMINTISEIVNLDQDGTQIYFLGNPTPYKGLVMNIITDVEKQPNNSVSTFHDFFKEAACRIDTVNTMVYLVTDGIMSVSGDTGKALVELGGRISSSLKGHPDLAGAIFRYVGEYKGDYWNAKNQHVTSKECPMLAEQIERPYYVVALGRKEAMRWLQKIPAGKLNNPEEYFMGVHDYAGHAKSVLAYGDSSKIENMNQDVTLVLELPECLKDIDPSEVKVVNAGDTVRLPVKKEGARLTVVLPPTQPLRPEADGRIKLTLCAPNRIPSKWTGEWNCDDDTPCPDQTSTFRLKHLVTGMYNALEGEQTKLKADFIYSRQ